jgi:hypothetical protein
MPLAPSRQQAYVPRVQMPPASYLSATAQAFLPEFEDSLSRAGYRPTNSAAEYQADLVVEEGPINVDTTLRLRRGQQVVAESRARQGGATKLLQGRKYAEQSFLKALEDFENRLPHGGGQTVPSAGPYYPSQAPATGNYNSNGADWSRGGF